MTGEKDEKERVWSRLIRPSTIDPINWSKPSILEISKPSILQSWNLQSITPTCCNDRRVKITWFCTLGSDAAGCPHRQIIFWEMSGRHGEDLVSPHPWKPNTAISYSQYSQIYITFTRRLAWHLHPWSWLPDLGNTSLPQNFDFDQE